MLKVTPLPVPRHALFGMPGYYVWCGTMARTADGRCHLWFSRWPKERGFDAWVTHSEVGYAVADDPLGPYRFVDVALPARGPSYWDGSVTHNPTVLNAAGRYYLYYTGNRGNGEFWTHRNHQRVGVAVAEKPEGPWERFDRPLVDVTPGQFDHLITTNPSVCQSPDGRCLMIYKTVSEGPMPFGGKVRHAAAWAQRPTGPFVRLKDPVMEHPTAKFAGEDPCVFWHGDRFYCVLKDMAGCFTGQGTGLVLFNSTDGREWTLADEPLVSGLAIRWADGATQPVRRLERPYVYQEAGRPMVLFCAALVEEDSYNVAMPLG